MVATTKTNRNQRGNSEGERGRTHFNQAEYFIARTLTMLLERQPSLLPILEEFACFDAETLKHSLDVGQITARTLNSCAESFSFPIPSEEIVPHIEAAFFEGTFHDVGKSIIDSKGPKESRIALYPELIEGNGHATPAQLEIIARHAPLGAQMLTILNKEGLLPIEFAPNVIKSAEDHHKKPPDLQRTHNKGEMILLEPQSQIDTLKQTIFVLSDMAEAMRAPRTSRNYYAFPPHTITQVLSAECTDFLIRGILGDGSADSLTIARFRDQIVGYVMKALENLDGVVSQRDYNLQDLPMNGFDWRPVNLEQGVILPKLSEEVWKIVSESGEI